MSTASRAPDLVRCASPGVLMNAHKDKRTRPEHRPLTPGTIICLKPVLLDLEPVSISEVRRSIQALNDGLELRYREPAEDEAKDHDREPPKGAS